MSLFRRGRPFFLANRYYRISNLIDCERISVDTPTTTGAQHTRKRSRLAALTDHTGKYTLCKLNFHTHFLVVVYPFQAGTEAHQPSTIHQPPTTNHQPPPGEAAPKGARVRRIVGGGCDAIVSVYMKYYVVSN